MIKKVILVFKTHFDIGFTDLAEKVIADYAGPMLEEVIATCNATSHMGKQKYVWTMPAWPLKVISERSAKELKAELERLISEGQIVWHALPFTSHTDCCSAEEYMEGLRYAKELSETYGKPYPISAKMTDVPGHGWMLPEILAGAGVKFLHLGCNAFATPPDVPFLFWWQAKSGKKVLTMYSKGGYGTSLLPPKDWEYPVWMALMHTHDNCGPQSASAIVEMVNRIHKEYPEVEVVCGTMDDFYLELEKSDLSSLPVVDSDLADTWIHGIGAYPREMASLRERREQMRRLQAIYAKESLYGTSKEVQELLDKYYEEVCLFEEHTWGADVKTWLGTERVYSKERFLKAKQQENYRFMEASWKEQSTRMTCASSYADEVKKIIVGEETEHSFLFNPNGTAFTGWTFLDAERWKDKQPVLQGKELPVLRLKDGVACYVSDFPAFTSLPLSGAPKIGKENTMKTVLEGPTLVLSNHRYTVFFNTLSGIITRVYDKKLDKVLLEAKGSKGVFSYQYHRYGIEKITEYLRTFGYRFLDWGIKDYGRENYPECDSKDYVPGYSSYEILENGLLVTYHTEESARKYGDAKKIELLVVLPPCGDDLFVEIHLQEKQETPFVESGSFLLPVPEENNQIRINKSGTVVDPKKDIRKNANHKLYAVENEIALSDARAGVCVVPCDTPLVAFGGTGIYEFQKEFAEPKEHTLYFNMFNNMWGTNFPQWQSGDIKCRYAIFGYEKQDESELAEKAAFLREGLEEVYQPVAETVVQLPEHMQLISARKEKAGMVLRFLERAGKAAHRSIVLPGCRITPVDLFGRKHSETETGRVDFEVKPNAIVSFLVERE